MAGSDIDRSARERVRRRIVGSGLQARNTQAARDALRRRQKEKKARIVKRHVRYKDKKKLLEQLARSERPIPIVAKELCRDDEEDLEGMQEPSAEATTPATHKEDGVADNALDENDQREKAVRAKADVDSKGCTDVADGYGAQDDDSIRQDKSAKRKKYIPFMKEQKEYERIQQEREAEENERTRKIQDDDSIRQDKSAKRKKYIPFMKEQKEYERIQQEREAEKDERTRKIEEREQMLQRSKKQRRAKTKQVRKMTPRGQPKLKYRLDAMLERIQKQ